MNTNKLDIIKKLREITGISIAKCSKTVNEIFDDSLTEDQLIERSYEYLRKIGTKVAADLATRVAEEGKVCILQKDNKAVMLLIGCNTDFVTRSPDFIEFSKFVVSLAIERDYKTTSELYKDTQITDRIADLSLKCGENILLLNFRRFDVNPGCSLGVYMHNLDSSRSLANEAALVIISSEDTDLANSIAQHIVGNDVKPVVISEDQITEEVCARELQVAQTQPQFATLPPDRLEMALNGYMKKRTSALSLLSQSYLRDESKTISQILNNAKVIDFAYMAGKV